MYSSYALPHEMAANPLILNPGQTSFLLRMNPAPIGFQEIRRAVPSMEPAPAPREVAPRPEAWEEDCERWDGLS